MNSILLFQTMVSTYPEGEKGVVLNGIEVVEYLLRYTIQWIMSLVAYFHAFSWQVKVSVLFLILCILSLLTLIVLLYRRIKRTHQHRNIYDRLLQAFQPLFRDMLQADEVWEDQRVEDRYKEAVNNFENPSETTKVKVLGPLKITDVPMELMIGVIMQIRLEKAEKLYLPNIGKLCRVTGVTDFYETKLVKRKRVMKTLQEILNLSLPISEGYLAIYINHVQKDVRYMARMCYVFCTQSDPYRYIDEDLQGEQPLWYPMMLHRMFGWLKLTGHQMPKFIYLAKHMQSADAAAFLIQEIAHWGDKSQQDEVQRFILSPVLKCREAAIEVIEKLKDRNAEDAIIQSFESQPEYLRRLCLKAIFSIGSKQHTDFFAQAYHSTHSQQTKLCALDCLLHYSKEGTQRFYQLQDYAPKEELFLFDQILGYDMMLQARKLHSL